MASAAQPPWPAQQLARPTASRSAQQVRARPLAPLPLTARDARCNQLAVARAARSLLCRTRRPRFTRSPPSPRISPVPTPHSLLPLPPQAHRSAPSPSFLLLHRAEIPCSARPALLCGPSRATPTQQGPPGSHGLYADADPPRLPFLFAADAATPHGRFFFPVATTPPRSQP